MEHWSHALGIVELITHIVLEAGQNLSESAGFRWSEGEYGKGSLRWNESLPVLTLRGSPEEMGEQIARLAVLQAPRLLEFPEALFRRALREALGFADLRVLRNFLWKQILKRGRRLLENFPDHHRRELVALIQTGVAPDQALAASTMLDLKNVTPAQLIFGCSGLVMNRELSETGHLLYGRNMDFFTLGYLHDYSLILVHQSPDRYRFVSVGFPGIIGCFSGMNEKGLAVGTHEVFFKNRTWKRFDKRGIPFALACRLVLEKCATVEEAVSLLSSIPRASITMLMVCDANEGAAIEMTPDQLVKRPMDKLGGACTNHFCSPQMRSPKQSNEYHTLDRFETLQATTSDGIIGYQEVAATLHRAHQNDLTIHTMIFEPETLTLQVAMGEGPSSRLPLQRLELPSLFG